MSKILCYRLLTALLLAVLLSAPASAQPSLKSSGYTENFDSMGPDGREPAGRVDRLHHTGEQRHMVRHERHPAGSDVAGVFRKTQCGVDTGAVSFDSDGRKQQQRL